MTGELKPKSKFLGNSAATIMEGEDRIRLLDRPEDGEYVITVSAAVMDTIDEADRQMPNTYARGILFGKMTLELCELSSINCKATDYHCDVDFKAKVGGAGLRCGAPLITMANPRAGSPEGTT